MNTKITCTSYSPFSPDFEGHFSRQNFTDYMKKLLEAGFDLKIVRKEREQYAYINVENLYDIKRIYDAIGIDMIITFSEDEEHMLIEIYDDYRE